VAEVVQIQGANSTAKIRNVVAVAILSLITLGIYVIFWWYYINREMADYGRTLGTDELGDNPGKSTLALFPGALIIVPAIWTTVTTFKRVQAAQRLSGQTQINGWLGLVIYVVISPVLYAYMQSGLNSVWRAQATAGSATTGG
jgi:heme/copper-type cytochrome/quinol oxidase subunit 2